MEGVQGSFFIGDVGGVILLDFRPDAIRLLRRYRLEKLEDAEQLLLDLVLAGVFLLRALSEMVAMVVDIAAHVAVLRPLDLDLAGDRAVALATAKIFFKREIMLRQMRDVAAISYLLTLLEQVLRDERLVLALVSDAFPDETPAVERILQERVHAARDQPESAARAETLLIHLLVELLYRILTGGVILEHAPHERSDFLVGHMSPAPVLADRHVA